MDREQQRKYWREYAEKRRKSSTYREEQRLIYRKWYKKHGRKRKKDYILCISEWQKSNPEAVKASYLLRESIRKGQISRSKKCSKCREVNRIVAHHPNYKEPLNIIWLCTSCHKLIHNVLTKNRKNATM